MPSTSRTRLVVVRHGETAWSAVGKHTGRTDVPLTPAGEAMARNLAPVLATLPVAAVWCSPLVRARRTAELAGVGSYEVVPDLAEWDYGAYEGRTRLEIQAERPGWEPFEHGFPGGETLVEVAARLDRVVARARTLDGDVLVVAHGHALKILAARWLGLDPVFGRAFALDTATVGILGWYHVDPAVERWNAPA